MGTRWIETSAACHSARNGRARRERASRLPALPAAVNPVCDRSLTRGTALCLPRDVPGPGPALGRRVPLTGARGILGDAPELVEIG